MLFVRLKGETSTLYTEIETCHFDEIFITSCSFYFQCSPWRKFHQNDDTLVSMYMLFHLQATYITPSKHWINSMWEFFFKEDKKQDHVQIGRWGLTSAGILVVELRWSYDHLISRVGFPLPLRQQLHFKQLPIWHDMVSTTAADDLAMQGNLVVIQVEVKMLWDCIAFQGPTNGVVLLMIIKD